MILKGDNSLWASQFLYISGAEAFLQVVFWITCSGMFTEQRVLEDRE